MNNIRTTVHIASVVLYSKQCVPCAHLLSYVPYRWWTVPRTKYPPLPPSVPLYPTGRAIGSGRFWGQLEALSEPPPGLGCVCDSPSPRELATMMNGHLSMLYCPTKSYAYHAFITNFCRFLFLPPFFGPQRLFFYIFVLMRNMLWSLEVFLHGVGILSVCSDSTTPGSQLCWRYWESSPLFKN